MAVSSAVSAISSAANAELLKPARQAMSAALLKPLDIIREALAIVFVRP
jgi:hypothetical protein